MRHKLRAIHTMGKTSLALSKMALQWPGSSQSKREAENTCARQFTDIQLQQHVKTGFGSAPLQHSSSGGEYTQCDTVWPPKRSEILMTTWNVNEHALTETDLKRLFHTKILATQPKIIVVALQEVENVSLNALPETMQDHYMYMKNWVTALKGPPQAPAGGPCPTTLKGPLGRGGVHVKNKLGDIDRLTAFVQHYGYEVPAHGTVTGANQLLFFAYKSAEVSELHLRSTVLRCNRGMTKGALGISCWYNTHTETPRKQICFISAHLSAHSDMDENKHPENKKYFLQRVDEMWDILHSCDAWYKDIHSLADERFLPFNIILEGDLNFRMIKEGHDLEYDEGGIVLNNFAFCETHKNFQQSYKVEKANTTERAVPGSAAKTDAQYPRPPAHYGIKRWSAWTDRITFHNPLESLLHLSQQTYGILDSCEGPSDHLPVYSTFNLCT